MIEYDLNFLFYNKPIEYQTLDGGEDPNKVVARRARIEFKKLMVDNILKDYTTLIIRSFKDQYPNEVALELALINYKFENGEQIYEGLFRKKDDISKVNFKYKEVIIDEGWETESLEELEIQFSESQDNLLEWVITELEDKVLSQNVIGDKTIIEVSESPISRIEITLKSLLLVINDDYFIEYH